MSTKDRKRLFASIQKGRKSKLLVYFLGDRPGQQTKIANDSIPLIFEHLEAFEKSRQIDLFLYTRGGLITTPPRIVELVREFTDRFCVLIPYKCHSAGTLVALGANEIVMTKMGELSPVEPQIESVEKSEPGHPFRQKPSVSVENFASYISFAKEMVGITEQEQLGTVLKELTEKVSPVDLGGVHRAYNLIRLIVKKLLSHHMRLAEHEQKVQEIADVLVEKFFSHEYLISRKEAKKLGLKIKARDDTLEGYIWKLFKEYKSYLALSEPFIAPIELGEESEKDVTVKRAVIESENMRHEFVSKIKLTKQATPIHQIQQQIQQAIAQKRISPEAARQMMMEIPPETVVENLYWQGWELEEN